MSNPQWYIYRLMAQTDGDLYHLDRQAGFSSHQAASDWVFKLGHKGDRAGQTFLFKRFFRDPPDVISLKAERAARQLQSLPPGAVL